MPGSPPAADADGLKSPPPHIEQSRLSSAPATVVRSLSTDLDASRVDRFKTELPPLLLQVDILTRLIALRREDEFRSEGELGKLHDRVKRRVDQVADKYNEGTTEKVDMSTREAWHDWAKAMLQARAARTPVKASPSACMRELGTLASRLTLRRRLPASVATQPSPHAPRSATQVAATDSHVDEDLAVTSTRPCCDLPVPPLFNMLAFIGGKRCAARGCPAVFHAPGTVQDCDGTTATGGEHCSVACYEAAQAAAQAAQEAAELEAAEPEAAEPEAAVPQNGEAVPEEAEEAEEAEEVEEVEEATEADDSQRGDDTSGGAPRYVLAVPPVALTADEVRSAKELLLVPDADDAMTYEQLLLLQQSALRHRGEDDEAGEEEDDEEQSTQHRHNVAKAFNVLCRHYGVAPPSGPPPEVQQDLVASTAAVEKAKALVQQAEAQRKRVQSLEQTHVRAGGGGDHLCERLHREAQDAARLAQACVDEASTAMKQLETVLERMRRREQEAEASASQQLNAQAFATACSEMKEQRHSLGRAKSRVSRAACAVRKVADSFGQGLAQPAEADCETLQTCLDGVTPDELSSLTVQALLERAFPDEDADEKAATCRLFARRLLAAARDDPAGSDDGDGDAAAGDGGAASSSPLSRWRILKQPEGTMHAWLDERACALFAGPATELNKALDFAETAPQPPHAKHKDLPDVVNKRLIALRSTGRASGPQKTHRVLCKAALAVAAVLDDETTHAAALHHLTHEACARRDGARVVDVCDLCKSYHAIAGRFEKLAEPEVRGGDPIEEASLFQLKSSRPMMLVADEIGVGAMVTGAKRARQHAALTGGEGGAPLLARERRRNVRQKRVTEADMAMAVLALRSQGFQECPKCLRALPNVTDAELGPNADAGQPRSTRPECSCGGRHGRAGRGSRR